MGIQVEFNPDLALRKYRTLKRLEEECLPENIEAGKVHQFLKEGQRNYWLAGEIPLLETKGHQNLSCPLASIRILSATHFLREGKVFTKGRYQVIEVYYIKDRTIHFEGMYKRIIH